ncbi:MAG: hypothetical protein V7782_08945 [Psychromonas sp.]
MTFRPQVFATILPVVVCTLLLSISLSLRAQNIDVQVTPENQESEAANVSPESMAFIAQNANETVKKRVQALHFLSQYPNQNSLVAVARALKDDNEMIREAAITGATPYPLTHRYRMVSPLLEDPVQAVRTAALVHLLKDFEQLQMGEQAKLRAESDQLIALLETDQSYSQQLLVADIYRWTFRFEASLEIYEKLLGYDDKTADLFLNLSHNYYAQEQNQQALNILNKGIAFNGEVAALYYSKALALVRLQQKDVAAISMNKATELAPDNAYYWYLNGVLQEPLDIDNAITSFNNAYLISGSPENLYAMCDIYVRNGHQNTEQCISALAEVAPQQVINELRSKQIN